MSKTAIAWLLIYSGGAILALVKHPIYGLLTYLFDYFNHPPLYRWGRGLPRLRWSFFIALITLISFILHKSKFRKTKASSFKWMLALIGIMVFVTYTSAVSVEESQFYLIKFVKFAVLYFLIVKIVQAEREYRLFIWAIILGCFLLGWRAYRAPSLLHGRLEGIGGPDTKESNMLPLLMIIPFSFVGFYLFIGRKWEKVLSIIVAPFLLNTIILCSSRGGVIALSVTAFMMLILGMRSLKFKVILIAVLGIVLFFNLVDQRFIERITTLHQPTEVDTAQERLETWKGAWRLMLDHPLGVGGGGFDLLSPVYIPEVVQRHGGQLRTVHNTYLLAGSDWGFAGLGLFILFLTSGLLQLHRVRWKLKDPRNRYYIESQALEAAFLGVLAGSIFVNRLYA
ncbi:hypothetical protein DRP53_10830, partial [candidate division WOR-3 bacterium]